MTNSMVVIHPWYTGRDKGAMRARGDTSGKPLTFVSVEAAKTFLRERGDAEWQVERNYRFPTVAEYYAT